MLKFAPKIPILALTLLACCPLLCLTVEGQSPTDPNSAGSGFEELSRQATAAREQHDFPRAVQLYNQALAANPSWTDGWWFLGYLEYDLDNYEQARLALTHVLEANPNAGPANALRGLCEFETADYAQALIDIQRGIAHGAVTNSKTELILNYHEALLLTRNARFDEALGRYAHLAKSGESNPELLLAMGLAGLRVALLPREVDDARRPVYELAGQAIFTYDHGDPAAAKAVFETLFQSYPKLANAHFAYGYLLFPFDPETAAEQWKLELQVAPENSTVNATLAWALLLAGHPDQALGYAQKAVALDPALSTDQLVLGRALVETGSLIEGMEHLQAALQADPDNLEVHYALVKAYSLSGRKLDAQRERAWCLSRTAHGGRSNG